MSSLDACMSRSRVHPSTAGIPIATIGVLLRKADEEADAADRRRSTARMRVSAPKRR